MGRFLPVPRQAIYCASKAAVKMFTEGLHSKLKHSKVGVTAVIPGGVHTNIVENTGAERERDESQNRYYKLLSPKEEAEIIIRGMENKEFRVLAGTDAKLMDFLYRFNPKKPAELIAKKLGKP